MNHRVISVEERYRNLFDRAAEAIVITSSGLCILDLNQTAQRLLGLTLEESRGKHLCEFCQDNSTDALPLHPSEWVSAICEKRELNLVGKNGGTTSVEVECSSIHFHDQTAYQFLFREITERSRLEQQLRQAEKLSALGQMISGIAHELNNPLAVIKGYLDLILARHELAPQTRADLLKVSHESNRAAKLVLNFLSFARDKPAHRETVNINDLISAVAELYRFELLVANVEFSLELGANLPTTHSDPDQIQQVIVNLLNNSIQAMVDTTHPHRLKISTRTTNGLVLIAVEDSGPGVPKILESKIFEPFFTTKPVGTGTGLGLSIAHSILSEHRGRLIYQTSCFNGAGFILELPIVAGDCEKKKIETDIMKPEPPVSKSDSAQILVLDDEKSIAELLCEMLDLLGHKTTLCLSGQQALDLIEQRQFDLILSDFRMPVMNGQEFYRRILEKNPVLARRIIFLTGDVVNEETQNFLRSTGNPHLGKPFQLANLERVVAEVLQCNEKPAI